MGGAAAPRFASLGRCAKERFAGRCRSSRVLGAHVSANIQCDVASTRNFLKRLNAERHERCISLTTSNVRCTGEKAFEEDKRNSGNKGPDDCTSHYNTRLNRCLILTTTDGNVGYDRTKYMVLYDAFEFHVFAAYDWISQKGKADYDVTPVTCEFELSYGKKEYCKSEDGFQAAVAKYMGGE
jgi:hypothetical protein